MKVSRQSDAVTWWLMGKRAAAKGYDTYRWAAGIKDAATRCLFLSGANGGARPGKRPEPPTPGVGLGHGTIDPEQTRAPAESWTIGVPLGALALLLVLGGPAALAGNYESNHFSGANANPGSRPGGFDPFNGCCGRTPSVVSDRPGSNFGTAFGRAIGSVAGWFSGPRTSLGQVNYSAPAYGIGHSSFNGGGSGSGGTAGT